MCTVYDVFKQVHKRPTDFKSRDSVPSLDLADWNRVRESISRKSSVPFACNALEWWEDGIPDGPYNDGDHISNNDDDDVFDDEDETDYGTIDDNEEEDPVEIVRQENVATSLPNFSPFAKTRTQSAFSWTPNKALEKNTYEIRRAIARQSIANGIGFELPASQTKLSINSEFQPQLYGLFNKKFRHEHDLWRERRGGVSPRYLSQTPKLKPPPPPKRFIPDIFTRSSPRDQFVIRGKPKSEEPTFRSTDLHSGNVTLPTAGMPVVRMRRHSLSRNKSSLELQEDVVNLWYGNSVQKAKHAFKKSLLKWKDGKKEEVDDPMEERKRTEVVAWLDKMKLK